ncbi:MAG: AraC family transcriptional regulator [Verrucomicrobia bacterium]|nr:AraC family transcriptional regulator [Verrucomicrobiota bacterium]
MGLAMKPLTVRLIPLAEWASLHTHLIWIYDGPVSSAGQGSMFSAHHAAWLLRRGRVEVRQGQQRWRAEAGQWLFPPPGDRSQLFSDDARLLSVRYRATWPTGEDFFEKGLGLSVAATAHPELLRAAMPLARFVDRNFPAATIDLMQTPAPLEVHFRLQTLFARWIETVVVVLTREGVMPSHMGRIDPRLLDAMRRLDGQPLSQPMAENTLARAVGLSVTQLNRLFFRQFGVSSRAYFEQRRFQHALDVLESSPSAVKEIAYELGFSSLPHFSAWFRRRRGLSPREFRQASPAHRALSAKNV